MQRWLKITIGISTSVIILFFIGGYIFYKMLTATLPEYSGEINAPGISEPIKIYRDSMAVPYIVAHDDKDAAFALGFIHAQERLFSMDIIRRAGEGRLSEILGTKTLPFDEMFRTVGIERIAKKIYGQLSPESKTLLQAYSNGVNFYLEKEKNKLPVEFDILGYTPEKWTPVSSLIIIRMMAWELNIGWWSDVALSDLVQKFGYDKVKEILPNYPENAPYIIPSGIKDNPVTAVNFFKTDMDFRNFIGWSGTHIGSNNWIVNGKLSASGKPVIANDTHLAFSAPGKWFAVVIKSKDWDAAGVTLPGAPAVVIGKNKNISWAVTNIMEDDADFYYEKIDSSGNNYFYNGNWEPLSIIKDTIRVKDSSNVVIEIKSTGHGPIISGIHPYGILFNDKNISSNNISMHWLGSYPSDELLTFYKINKTKNWDEFRAAFSTYSVPGQNFVYGDAKGNIGYVFGAKLPVRASNNPGFIYDGTTSENDWKGFVPLEDLPSLYNPPENYIASANNKTVNDFKYYITNLWEPPSRIERITGLLTSKPKQSVEDFKQYQNDLVSPYAKEMTSYILNAFKDVKVTDSNLNLALRLFKNWNYKLDQYEQVAAIYEVCFKYLLRNIFLNKMGQDLFNEFVFVQNIPFRSIMQLMNDPNSGWFDDPSTSRPENRDEVIRKSLVQALNELEKNYGSDITSWQWGRMHYVVFKHIFSGVSPMLDKIIDIGPFPVGGDGTTIFNTEYPFTTGVNNVLSLKHGQYENNLGPVVRYIYDFSKPDQFYLILNTGESGNVLSKHYRDMSKMWLEGKYMKIKTDLDDIENNKNKLLIIK